MLRIALWNAALMMRGPVQFFLSLLMLLHLGALVGGVVFLFLYGDPVLDKIPFLIRVVGVCLMAAIFTGLSWLSYALDAFVFRLTPQSRLLFLWS